MRIVLSLILTLIATPCHADPVTDLAKCIAERNEVIADRAVLTYQYVQLGKHLYKREKVIAKLKKRCGKKCKKIK